MIGLVVAPSAIAARIVEQLVLKAGCNEVRSFHCATEAEAAVRTHLKPALLATEWDLPDRSGLTLAAAIREALERPDFPVLLIGTRNTREDVLEALDAGVDVYILKPIDPDVFVQRAAALLSSVGSEETASRSDAAEAGSEATAAGSIDAPGEARIETETTVGAVDTPPTAAPGVNDTPEEDVEARAA